MEQAHAIAPAVILLAVGLLALLLARPLRISIGSTMFSTVVFHGSSVACWNIMPMSGRGPSTGRPSSTTRPRVGGSSPAMILSRVDLPQPEEPITDTNSPLPSVRLTSVSATSSLRA